MGLTHILGKERRLTREVVLRVINDLSVPAHRQEIARLVREDYGHVVNPGTVFKWLSILVSQGRIEKTAPGVYASHTSARRFKDDDAALGE